MSADGVSSYVKKVVSPTVSLPVLLANVNQQLTSSKSRGGRQFLAELREVCLYSVPGQLYPSTEYAMGLLRMVEDSGDPDIDKKSLRVCYFLLFEYIYSQHIGESTYEAVFTSLVSYLQSTVSRLSGASLCLAWRHLGRTANLVLSKQGRQHSSYLELTSTIHHTMKALTYPEKKKGFMGREKVTESYENSLHMWTAVFSALRRAENAPTKECMPVVFQGCMSSHQALSRHGFSLLRRAVESDPAVFCPFLLEKLKTGQFFSHASIDAMNCSQLVNACRIMMTSDGATPDMILNALTVIFNLLRSPRLAIVLESVRALTEAPQAWAFKETLAELGGPSIPSRIAEALLQPISQLNIRVEKFIVLGNEADTAVDDIDGSVHISPKKASVHGSSSVDSSVRGKAGPLSPVPGVACVVPNIGEGDVSWGPLCRACVRLGLYMVHRPLDDIDGLSAEDDDQMIALLDAIRSTLAILESIDAKVAARNPLCNSMGVPLATLSVLPHVKSELLKAYFWLLPENRSCSDKCTNMWVQMERTMVLALPSLSENIIEALLSNIVARVKATKTYSKELVSMCLSLAEAALAASMATSTVLGCLLTQIWTVVGEIGLKWSHASAELLASVLRCTDGSILQNEHGVITAPHAFSVHGMTAAQVMRGLHQHSYWVLGEYIHLWVDVSSLRNAYCFENVAYHGERTAITEIMPRILNAMWIERGSVQLSALEALYKVALYASKLSAGDPNQEPFGIVSYIRHEMNAFLGSIVGVDASYDNSGWVLQQSESQRLASIGLPPNIGARADFLKAVSRGQYTDDCTDIRRSTSAYLLALDAIWKQMVSDINTPSAALNVMDSHAPSLTFDFGNADGNAKGSVPSKAGPGEEANKLELLKLQLTLNPS